MPWSLPRAVRFLLLGFAGVALAQSPNLDQINRELESATGETLPALLNARAQALIGLMEADPARALTMLLPPAQAARMRASGRGGDIEREGEWEGTLEVAVADNFTKRTSQTLLSLHAGGETLRLHIAGPPPQAGCGDTVRVAGVRLRSHLLARSAQTIRALSAASCAVTTGAQQVVAVLVNMPSQALPSFLTPSYVNQYLFGSGGHSLTGYWNEASYGRASAAGTVVGPFTLAQDYTCEQSDQILAAAIAAADSSVNLTNYNRLFVIFPLEGSCVWEGLGSIGCTSELSPLHGNFVTAYSMFVADYLNTNDVGVALSAHEGGHNLKLNHSSTLTFASQALGAPGDPGVHDEYGDFFSVMGYIWTSGSGSFLGHYNSPHKTALGWFSSGNVQAVTSSGTFIVQPYETPSTGVQALRIQRGSGILQYLWVEYRQPLGTDVSYELLTSNPYTGAWIHFEDPAATQWAGYTHLLDFTPNTAGVFTDAALAAGSTWSDPYTNLSLTVNSATTAGLSVTVNYGAPCATLGSTTANYSSNAANGTITVTGNCSSVAASNASWITITGGSSLSGSGLVSYSVAANSTGSQRSGTISAARQTFTVTQAATAQSTPILGIAETHGGTFFAGQSGATYYAAVTNSGALATSGTVTLVESVPSGMTLLSMSGAGWSCSSNTCTRSDALAPGASYPPVSIPLNIAVNAALSLTNQVTISGGGSPSAAIGDVTAIAATLVIPANVFVPQLYLDLLDRPADPSGSAYWQNQITSGALTRSQEAAGFFLSNEFSNSGYYVVKLYLAGLRREPDYAGWLYWFGALQSGASAASVVATFVGSAEFATQYGGLSNSAFVTKVYQNLLGRSPDAAGLQYYTALLNNNQMSRAGVFDLFVRSGEYDSIVRAHAYTDLLYLGFLRRAPEPTGQAYWQASLAGGNPLPAVISAFISSLEYLSRLAPLVPAN